MLPVSGSRVTPGLVDETWVKVALPPDISTARAPLTVSFAATLGTAVDALPDVAKPVSVSGKIDAVTVSVTVVSAQFTGVDLSQS